MKHRSCGHRSWEDREMRSGLLPQTRTLSPPPKVKIQENKNPVAYLKKLGSIKMPLLQVAPARLERKLEQGFWKLGLVQFGSSIDSNNLVKQDSSSGSGDDGGKNADISIKTSVSLEIPMSDEEN
ncbi:hypothetical protein LXL04_012769 [Taraxacum kok-saghyz]